MQYNYLIILILSFFYRKVVKYFDDSAWQSDKITPPTPTTQYVISFSFQAVSPPLLQWNLRWEKRHVALPSLRLWFFLRSQFTAVPTTPIIWRNNIIFLEVYSIKSCMHFPRLEEWPTSFKRERGGLDFKTSVVKYANALLFLFKPMKFVFLSTHIWLSLSPI